MRSACPGDSGGPLVAATAGVFTRVSAYLSFLQPFV